MKCPFDADYIDMDNWVINYPYGNYNRVVCGYAKSRGAKIGLTTEVRMARLGTDCIMTLPRLDCNDFPPKSDQWKSMDEENFKLMPKKR